MKNIEGDIFLQGSRYTPTLTSILSPGTTVLHSLTAVLEFQREKNCKYELERMCFSVSLVTSLRST